MGYSAPMSTITAILAPDADGTLHLPVPAAWSNTLIRVKAELEPMPGAPTMPEDIAPLKGFGCLKGKIRMASDFNEPLDDFKDYVG